jgi:pSer/pThr/pTyr-binding forkhead associated (FHA) protein
MNCPHCGRDSDPLFKFCLHCGKELGGKKPVKKPAAIVETAPEPVPEPVPSVQEEMTAPVPDIADDVSPVPAAIPEPVPKPVATPVAPPPEPKVPKVEGSIARCPRCRAKVPGEAVTCPLCGYDFGQGGAEAVRQGDLDSVVQAPLPDDAVGYLISVSSVDGRETTKLPLKAGVNSLGRGEECDIRFPEDDLLSPLHLQIIVEKDSAMLTEPGSRNGSFLRATDQVKLEDGALFRIGQQLLRFEELEQLPPVVTNNEDGTEVLGSPAGARTWGRLAQVVTEKQTGSCFLLTSENVFLGRERGNITFPGDRYISGTHAVITRKADGPYLRDVGSSNGTYVQIQGGAQIVAGQYFLAGRQLFKLYLGK